VEALKQRTVRFALATIRFYSRLPKDVVSTTIGRQFLRSGTSVGAQYHEAIRARSDAEFISKLESAQQELEETRYWFILIGEAEPNTKSASGMLLKEIDELMAIFSSVIVKVKQRKQHRVH
jgi:four helix bundle protein